MPQPQMQFPAIASGSAPANIDAGYKSTTLRGPKEAFVALSGMAAASQPIAFDPAIVTPRDADLTQQGAGAPLGERIVVTGRVTDEDGKPVRHSLVEIWQCSSTGRYPHRVDQHDAPLDPNFPGHGKALTNSDGHYRFITIKPGAYPWGNHKNAWRPAHIHFSLFGQAYAQRLITQMYFPGDPLFAFDPIYNSIPDVAARERLVSAFKLEHTVEGWALGYEFNIVLRGKSATPFGV
jgi:protocatechuate 3,4-dioxygenase, beta subunit